MGAQNPKLKAHNPRPETRDPKPDPRSALFCAQQSRLGRYARCFRTTRLSLVRIYRRNRTRRLDHYFPGFRVISENERGAQGVHPPGQTAFGQSLHAFTLYRSDHFSQKARAKLPQNTPATTLRTQLTPAKNKWVTELFPELSARPPRETALSASNLRRSEVQFDCVYYVRLVCVSW